jgi:hypothetical protein
MRGGRCSDGRLRSHARGHLCNRQLIYVESDVSDFKIQGDSPVHKSKVDISSPLACRVSGVRSAHRGSLLFLYDSRA